MKLLAIDTSTELASVAVLSGEEITCEEQGSQRTHAQLLLPMINRQLVQAGLQMNQLDGIIFGCGPGSFTGLRIACSIAKGLAYAHDLDLIPVSSLAAIAWAAREHPDCASSPIVAVLDARMHEMYWGFYPADQWEADERVNPAQEISLPVNQPVVLAGVGIELYWNDFSDLIKSQISSRLNLFPNAAAMIKLVQHTGINPVPAAQAQPVYVRNQVTQGDSRG
ncbi:tRNA (adenosine(37)-N6)-threonylcarbamoyltransferase complex dimerization subunit type 1 TsaB [Legionella bononiensis]|uniref:tRNA threonylcarbamoyladenosine biosynthesis protein TsaB n=1 Tax=Legionella bononiensis TaxID=2793102 RepID=A0ABS1WEF1_9GAMM|nr:tRNA (adenosine(37)-N6)-threonylcarbamoyltransferase complex dimerization subunit type 1 TsaB [Legionella bononiensis]MBL7479402.1 tRNA (adenosine(37)-N6)-threonylcarbamoyltransferase complex dimerization subunit type 1 TsaB [Legionella bononiensis]MBL7527725.1 tRNA (adenosine(37)-N6)-threonylcarbamoyltransferase complex dimerization subunit type 1 TsaB [Legionella bononiensis]MBL7563592.1 tRNA (adenosine(37)-N6)-threonylcarbamoyltransferase complex dimerization subunit type 1 TsaB [Legionell